MGRWMPTKLQNLDWQAGPLNMLYKGTNKENNISTLVWKLYSSFHFTVNIKVYCESFGFSNKEQLLRRKAPRFKQYGEIEDN